MERRDFIKLCSMTGLAVAAGASASRSEAKVENYTGPLHLFVHQGGGWDVTNICDPKGGASLAETDTQGESDVMNHYLTSDIGGNAGGVRWAPLETVPQLAADAESLVNKKFFSKFASELLVINGIDMMTNSHDVGTRAIWAGDLTEGKPTVAALIAAALNPESPMAFVSFGGYDITAGTVASTRLG
ncbi:MAG TPA: twin-arginine translocation signal domain-containing protein, partial [Polyangiaceae bacterium]|nr:twin-arginine translocation signal domain-containing protein [Polyangiaceae bacterium]